MARLNCTVHVDPVDPIIRVLKKLIVDLDGRFNDEPNDYDRGVRDGISMVIGAIEGMESRIRQKEASDDGRNDQP